MVVKDNRYKMYLVSKRGEMVRIKSLNMLPEMTSGQLCLFFIVQTMASTEHNAGSFEEREMVYIE